jgi:hypothetical protein
MIHTRSLIDNAKCFEIIRALGDHGAFSLEDRRGRA